MYYRSGLFVTVDYDYVLLSLHIGFDTLISTKGLSVQYSMYAIRAYLVSMSHKNPSFLQPLYFSLFSFFLRSQANQCEGIPTTRLSDPPAHSLASMIHTLWTLSVTPSVCCRLLLVGHLSGRKTDICFSGSTRSSQHCSQLSSAFGLLWGSWNSYQLVAVCWLMGLSRR